MRATSRFTQGDAGMVIVSTIAPVHDMIVLSAGIFSSKLPITKKLLVIEEILSNLEHSSHR